jgi:hypothetical protein
LSGGQITGFGEAVETPAKMKLPAAERSLLNFLHAGASVNSKS